MNRQHRFEALWARFFDVPAAAAWTALDRGYSDESRAYHNWSHIDAMLDGLDGLDGVRGEAEFVGVGFGEVELAIFFHDAVYDPLAKDNEAKSAALLTELAGEAGDPVMLQRVAAMILATARHAPSEDESTRLLLDLDLRILGAGEEEYARYARAVRAEYAAVPDAAWRAGRLAVLRRFLERRAIYQTAHFHRLLETAARRNIESELAALEG